MEHQIGRWGKMTVSGGNMIDDQFHHIVSHMQILDIKKFEEQLKEFVYFEGFPIGFSILRHLNCKEYGFSNNPEDGLWIWGRQEEANYTIYIARDDCIYGDELFMPIIQLDKMDKAVLSESEIVSVYSIINNILIRNLVNSTDTLIIDSGDLFSKWPLLLKTVFSFLPTKLKQLGLCVNVDTKSYEQLNRLPVKIMVLQSVDKHIENTHKEWILEIESTSTIERTAIILDHDVGTDLTKLLKNIGRTFKEKDKELALALKYSEKQFPTDSWNKNEYIKLLTVVEQNSFRWWTSKKSFDDIWRKTNELKEAMLIDTWRQDILKTLRNTTDYHVSLMKKIRSTFDEDKRNLDFWRDLSLIGVEIDAIEKVITHLDKEHQKEIKEIEKQKAELECEQKKKTEQLQSEFKDKIHELLKHIDCLDKRLNSEGPKK